MTNSSAHDLAQVVAAVRKTRTPLSAVAPHLVPATQDDGYAVQQLVHDELKAGGLGEIVGHKIGCTTKVMQEYMQIDTPCAGGIFSSTVAQNHGTFVASAHQKIGVECEIAVRLATDLTTQADQTVSHDQAAASIATCMAAIEIVEDRYEQYSTLATPVLIADDFFNAGCVLGDEHADFDPHQLDRVTATMEVNGVAVGSGRGSDVLGHPLTSLAWLATERARRGEPLKAGEFVLLGSVVQTYWLEPGDVVRIINDPFGEATFTLEA